MTQEPIQVLEQDLAPPPREPAPRRQGLRLALVVTAIVTVGIGLGLLPDAAPPTAIEATLPVPAVATTLVDSDRVMVGVISPDGQPLAPVPSLDGFTSLAGPAQIGDGSWWMIGNEGNRAAVLRSKDGVEWEPEDSIDAIDADGQSFLLFGDLISAEGQLVAIGYELISVNGVRTNRLQAWHSADGAVWNKELIANGIVFNDMQLVANGGTMVATFSDGSGSYRLYRRITFEPWEAVHLGLPTSREVMRAPQGGFMVSDDNGDVLTSAYGVIWRRNGAIEPGFYTSWGQRAVGIAANAEVPSLYVMAADDFDVIELPDEVAGCHIEGGPQDLLAICRRGPQARFDIYTSSDGLVWSRSPTEVVSDDLVYEGAMPSGFLFSTVDGEGQRVVTRAGGA